MVDTKRYDLEHFPFSGTGWTGEISDDMSKIDGHLWTRVLVTLGEAVAAGEAVYLQENGKGYIAQADGTKQPAIGLAIEAGVLDEVIRVQRKGPFALAAWGKPPRTQKKYRIPYPLWLDDTNAGALSHHKPGSNAQYMGYADTVNGDSIFLDIEDPPSLAFPGTSSSTTTTTTTTTTTSSTTTTTTSP